MFKRFTGLTLVLLLLTGTATLVWSQAECDFSYSNYARAVQLHDMGDYARALRHYECARLEDPDSAIIPLLIENLHEDSANAGSAWSSRSERAQKPICSPDLDHWLLGKQAYDHGDSNQAEIHLQCILLGDPTDGAALYLMGSIHINRGDTHTAQHYFDRAEAARRAASESPTDVQALAQTEELEPPPGFEMPDWLTPYEIAPDTRVTAQVQPIVLFSERSRLLLQTERSLIIADDESLTYWQRLRKLYIEQIRLVIATGEMTVTLYQRQVFAMSREARITFSAADRLAEAREQARLAARQGDLDEAIKWMLRVASAPGVTADDYAYLASLYSTQGDMAAAALALSAALELEPARLDIRCNLGRVYSSLGDYAKAFTQFYTVISKDIGAICPKENDRALNRSLNATASVVPAPAPQASLAQATFERGLAMLNDRKLFAAANTFMEALAIDPDHHEARCQFGIVLNEWSNYGWALANFDRILADDPRNDCARQNRKVAILDMLAMYIPLTVDDFFYRARTFAQVEEWELARDAFHRGLELDPTRTDARCELGMIYAQLGDERAALEQFDRVLAQHVVDSCAWSNRDALMKRLRDER